MKMPVDKSFFHQLFGNYIDLSEDAVVYLQEHFRLVSFDARELIVQAGTVAKHFYFVISGVQAIYLTNRKGDKVVTGFSYHGSPSGVYDSFLTQEPSAFFLESLTLSELIAINLEDYTHLFERFPEFAMWRIHFMENILFGRGKREVEMLTLTAKERFDTFMARCPPELMTIPQKYLASYLNVTPETFSRMRAQKN